MVHREDARDTQPVALFVHGAFHGAWCWDAVREKLTADGVRSMALELPFTGFADDVAEVRRAVAAVGAPTVVCAHSYGGRVLTVAADPSSEIVHLVYLAALMLGTEQIPRFAERAQTRPPVQLLELDLVTVHQRYYNDCTLDEARAAFARFRPVLGRPYGTENMGPEPWRHVPATYVVCSEDRVMDPELQREMATNASYVVELASGHSPFVSRPDLLASIVGSICTTGAP